MEVSTTPASRGETITVYTDGFGPTSVAVVSASITQSGVLSPLPVMTIGGIPATVSFAGLVALGEFQFTGLVNRIADQSLRMVRSLAWMVLAIGIALQALLVGAAQRLRTGETAIARALGARPGFLARVSFCEFGLLGLLAGIAGGLLGAGLASLMLSVIFHRTSLIFDPGTMRCAAVFTSLMAATAGSFVVARSQRLTPLEILRDE